MKKTNSQKGITLVALIITIIVLLILAVVAIRAVQGDGIIRHAQNAKDNYVTAQGVENSKLLETEYKLESAQNSNIGTYEEYVLEKKYGLKIGDYVNYKYDKVSSGYRIEKGHSGSKKGVQVIYQISDLKWRVLGLDENNNIELISSVPVENTYIYLNDAAGYNNGVYILNDLCKSLYSNKELKIEARSIRIEDIEKKFTDLAKYEIANYKDSYRNIWRNKKIFC